MSRPKILIVEDDRPLSDVLQYNFVQAGFDVFQSFDGQDGVNQARLRLPEVIVLDVMIPVLDGIEVCRKLRSVEETKNLGSLGDRQQGTPGHAHELSVDSSPVLVL